MEVLKNKTTKSYDNLSRYSVVPIYYNTLTRKYDTGTSTYLDSTTAYSLYKVKNGDSYDSIALDTYENPSYYWVICSFNKIQDPFNKPEVGSYLKLPVISYIAFE